MLVCFQSCVGGERKVFFLRFERSETARILKLKLCEAKAFLQS